MLKFVSKVFKLNLDFVSYEGIENNISRIIEDTIINSWNNFHAFVYSGIF